MAVFSRNGRPLSINVVPSDENYAHLVQVLEQGGAIITHEPHLAEIIVSLTPVPGSVRNLWVDHSLETGEALPLEQYGYFEEPKNVNRKKGRGHIKFNPAKDEYILERVRENPRMRKLLQFYEKLAQTDELRGHTGNLVRSRFNHHLAQKLQWVYEQDEEGFKLDAQGQRIRTTDIPDTRKVMFDHKDDYFLCCQVAEHKSFPSLEVEISNLDEFYRTEVTPRINDGHLEMMPFQFYGKLAKTRSHHSQNSWRDHYRKYVLPEAVPYYLAYYAACQQFGKVPKKLPRKHQYESAKINANRKRARSTPLDEEIGQTANLDLSHTVDVARVAQEARFTESEAEAAVRQVWMMDNVATEEELTGAAPKRAKIEDHRLRYMNDNLGVGEFVDVNQFDMFGHDYDELADELAELSIITLRKRLKQLGFMSKFIDHVYLTCLMAVASIVKYIREVGPKLAEAVMVFKQDQLMSQVLAFISPGDAPEFWTLARDHRLLRFGDEMNAFEADRHLFILANRDVIDPDILLE